MYPDMFPKTITILKYHCRVRAVYVNRNKVQHVFGIPDIWGIICTVSEPYPGMILIKT